MEELSAWARKRGRALSAGFFQVCVDYKQTKVNTFVTQTIESADAHHATTKVQSVLLK
jgi:hypothetical protein